MRLVCVHNRRHGKLDVDVGEVATGGDSIPMTRLFLI